jgi:hypothetical protein
MCHRKTTEYNTIKDRHLLQPNWGDGGNVELSSVLKTSNKTGVLWALAWS